MHDNARFSPAPGRLGHKADGPLNTSCSFCCLVCAGDRELQRLFIRHPENAKFFENVKHGLWNNLMGFFNQSL